MTESMSVLGAPGLVRFGIFDWIDQGRRDDLAELYEQRLQMIEHADRLGFWGYHLAEHHCTPLGMSPSPNVFLAAAAQRTRRIRLGPLVNLLPLYNPIRLVYEICMLDQLSRGRLELGVGRGVSPLELAAFNIDTAESRDIFREALEIVLAGLETGRVDHQGRYYSFSDAEIFPRPFQRPYPPLWYPTSNPESLPWAAAEGFSAMFGFVTPSLADTADHIRLYRQVHREHSAAGKRLNGHVAEPKVGLARHVYVAETDAEALRDGKEAYEAFFESFNYLWARHGIDRFREFSDFSTFVERRLMLVGSPSTVRDQLKECVEAVGANYFAAVFAFGNLSTDRVLRSMDRFAEEVAPAFVAAGKQRKRGG